MAGNRSPRFPSPHGQHVNTRLALDHDYHDDRNDRDHDHDRGHHRFGGAEDGRGSARFSTPTSSTRQRDRYRHPSRTSRIRDVAWMSPATPAADRSQPPNGTPQRGRASRPGSVPPPGSLAQSYTYTPRMPRGRPELEEEVAEVETDAEFERRPRAMPEPRSNMPEPRLDMPEPQGGERRPPGIPMSAMTDDEIEQVFVDDLSSRAPTPASQLGLPMPIPSPLTRVGTSDREGLVQRIMRTLRRLPHFGRRRLSVQPVQSGLSSSEVSDADETETDMMTPAFPVARMPTVPSMPSEPPEFEGMPQPRVAFMEARMPSVPSVSSEPPEEMPHPSTGAIPIAPSSAAPTPATLRRALEDDDDDEDDDERRSPPFDPPSMPVPQAHATPYRYPSQPPASPRVHIQSPIRHRRESAPQPVPYTEESESSPSPPSFPLPYVPPEEPFSRSHSRARSHPPPPPLPPPPPAPVFTYADPGPYNYVPPSTLSRRTPPHLTGLCGLIEKVSNLPWSADGHIARVFKPGETSRSRQREQLRHNFANVALDPSSIGIEGQEQSSWYQPRHHDHLHSVMWQPWVAEQRGPVSVPFVSGFGPLGHVPHVEAYPGVGAGHEFGHAHGNGGGLADWDGWAAERVMRIARENLSGVGHGSVTGLDGAGGMAGIGAGMNMGGPDNGGVRFPHGYVPASALPAYVLPHPAPAPMAFG